VSARPWTLHHVVTEQDTPGFGFHPLMPLPSRRKVSGSFMPLLTTSTSFVTTPPTRSTVNHLPRIVVAEAGLATSQLETVGATHSRLGKRCYFFLSSPSYIFTTTPGLLVRSIQQHQRIPTSSRARWSTNPLDRTSLSEQCRFNRLAPCRCLR